MNVRRFSHLAWLGAALGLAWMGMRVDAAQGGAASLSGFFLPGFGADGTKTWDIQGSRSEVNPNDEGHLEIKDMLMRLFTGGAQSHLEMTISSAQATVNVAEHGTHVNGTSILHIDAADGTYSVSGYDWRWDSADASQGQTQGQLIHLGRNVSVNFSSTEGVVQGSNRPPHPVTILSDTLDITQQPAENHFHFTGNISISDRGAAGASTEPFLTTCEELVVLAARLDNDAASGPVNMPTSLTVQKGGVHSIVAQNHVVSTQGSVETMSGQSQLFPNEQKVIMTDSPEVHLTLSSNTDGVPDHAVLYGGCITWLRDQQVLDVGPVPGAASLSTAVRVSLPSNSPPRAGDSSAQLIITGETLHAQFSPEQRRFDLDRTVHVDDPRYSIDSQHLLAEFDPPPSATAKPAAPASTKSASLIPETSSPVLGQLRHLALSENVVFTQSNLHATTPFAEVLPEEDAVRLSGGVEVVDALSNTTIHAGTIKLATDGRHADILAPSGAQAELDLPSIPLGSASANIATTILCDAGTLDRGLDPQTGQGIADFNFTGNVHVSASSLNISSGQLEANTVNLQPANASDTTQDLTKHVQIVRLVAHDHVVVVQPGFTALAATVEVNPQVANVSVASPTQDTQSFRLIQLEGDSSGQLGPVRPQVVVPLPNVDQQSISIVPGASAPASPANPPAGNATAIITSDQQWLFTSEQANYYMFMGHVTVDTGLYKISSDKMLVNCTPVKVPDGATANSTLPRLAVDNITAEGNVVIIQGDKGQGRATADKAILTPRDDKAVLTGNTVVVNNETGYRLENNEITITLHGGKSPVVTGTAESGHPLAQPTFYLPGNFNLDEFKPKKPAEKDSNKSGH